MSRAKKKKRGQALLPPKKDKPLPSRRRVNLNPIDTVSESNLAPGAKGAKIGKLFEDKMIAQIKKWFKCKEYDNADFSEDYLNLHKGKLVLVPQYQSNYRVDILLINPKVYLKNNKKGILAIECRWYGGGAAQGGSLEQRLHAWFSEAQTSGLPSIVVRGGFGWSERYIDMAEKDMNKFSRVLGMFNSEEKSEVKELKEFIRKNLRLK